MKTFKLYDLLASIALIIIFLVISLFQRDYSFLIGYFVIGAWQLISMIIHIYYNWFTQKGGKRYYYSCTVFIIIVITVLGFVIYPFLLIFYLMLFAAPFMAVYYAWICYKEVIILRRRPLYQLK
ncbi:MAG: hypothetical protein HY252_11995 [Sphingobacteriales bacterium]|nr:hypothetical protein [Sphingobacteriales bacterium]